MNEAYIGLEKDICNEIRDWSAYALEEKSHHFNGFSPCPYAQKAWEDNRVSIVFKSSSSYQPLYDVISQFEDTQDVVLLVDLFYSHSKVFHQKLEQVNEDIAEGGFIDKDIWVMGFHPEDEPNELIDDGTFDQQVDTLYAMIFVQRLSKLQEASQKLAALGYYDGYTGNYSLFEKRTEVYRRLKDGQKAHISA